MAKGHSPGASVDGEGSGHEPEVGIPLVLGGSVIEWLRASDAVVGWRVALVVAGIPGMVGAIALRRIHLATALEREPVQDPIDPKAAAGLGVAALLVMGIQILAPPIAAVPLSAAIAALVGGWSIRNLARVDAASFDATLGQPAFRWWLLAFGALLFVDYAAVFWLLPYAQRRYSVSPAMAGGELGGLLIVGGVLGCLVGGWWADRWRRRRHAGRVLTALIAVLCEGFAISAAICMPHYPQFVGAFAIFCVASGGWTGVAAAIGLDIVPRQHRGIATALYFLVTTVVGPGLGPFTVGWISDRFASIGDALAWSCTVLAMADLGLRKLAFAMHQTPLNGPGGPD